jgi:hypothetical protein
VLTVVAEAPLTGIIEMTVAGGAVVNVQTMLAVNGRLRDLSRQ